MGPRNRIRRLARLAACVIVAGCLSGCGASNKVTFTNVSESWLNVRFFVGTTQGSTELLSKRTFQVKPGETAKFAITRSKSNRTGEHRLVHVQVEAVTPSWDPPGHQYWMELITEGPVKIVARGKGEKLDFETGAGEVARIPNKQLKKRFEHRIAGAPTSTP
jgi:hypothetical protein